MLGSVAVFSAVQIAFFFMKAALRTWDSSLAKIKFDNAKKTTSHK